MRHTWAASNGVGAAPGGTNECADGSAATSCRYAGAAQRGADSDLSSGGTASSTAGLAARGSSFKSPASPPPASCCMKRLGNYRRLLLSPKSLACSRWCAHRQRSSAGRRGCCCVLLPGRVRPTGNAERLRPSTYTARHCVAAFVFAHVYDLHGRRWGGPRAAVARSRWHGRATHPSRRSPLGRALLVRSDFWYLFRRYLGTSY